MPSKKVLDEKQKVVSDLVNEFQQAQSIVFADYRGLTVEQDTSMRAAMRKGGVRYKVVKNTLSDRALREVGVKGVEEFLKGPTAIAYSIHDAVCAAKIVKEYADKYDKLNIKGGIVEGKIVSAAEVNQIALIPGKEILYSQVVFGLVSPIASLAMILKAIMEKDESGSGETAESVAQVVAE